MKESLKCNDNFDIELNDSGMVAIVKDASSIANMLKLDFMSNSDWELDSDLGLNWFNKDNDGFLQKKDTEILIINELQKKIENLEGVREIKEININRTLSRQLIIDVTIIAEDGSIFSISNRSEVN